MRKFLLLLGIWVSPVVGETLDERIRSRLVPYHDFPCPGVVFNDIGPLLEDTDLFATIVDSFAARYADRQVDAVVALDARGFLFGSALAYKLKVPLVMARKQGKLPGQVVTATFQKMYGEDGICMRVGAIHSGWRVVLVDDFVSSGGTLEAAAKLVRAAGGTVHEAACVINNPKARNAELSFDVHALATLMP